MKNILIIDDNKSLVEMLEDLLVSEGFNVDYFFSIEEIDDYIILNKYDLILLDIMLGETNGVEFLELVRNDIKKPVLFLTAKNTKADIIKGLNVGGDDYITKPFDNDYLVAKIKSHIRRDVGTKNKILEFENVIIDINIRSIQIYNEIVEFTKSEFDIIYFLSKNPSRTYNKEELFSGIYGINPNSEVRVVTQHIYQIRKKFSDYGIDPIENIWGVGYRWKLT